MTKLLEQYSQNKMGARVCKVIIVFTLMPAIILRAIVLDMLTEKQSTIYD